VPDPLRHITTNNRSNRAFSVVAIFPLAEKGLDKPEGFM
jgi:hypothetical protein